MPRRSVRKSAGPSRKLGAITLRLEARESRKLALLAKRESRSIKNYVETLVRAHIAHEPEADRVISMYVAPELVGVRHGKLKRSEDESDERYAQRKALFDELMTLPDAE